MENNSLFLSFSLTYEAYINIIRV